MRRCIGPDFSRQAAEAVPEEKAARDRLRGAGLVSPGDRDSRLGTLEQSRKADMMKSFREERGPAGFARTHDLETFIEREARSGLGGQRKPVTPVGGSDE